jgi:small-conductance mechanosensitive channel
MKSLLIAHLLALTIIAGLLTASRGAFARSWPRIVAGAGAVGAALGLGYWIF